ncbi:MAG: serine/threonine protein kinase, partial [Deltaproteobacteria bacterium]|nr:serine/threonine protein kinase [Deltaproteobacteria bacterium]
MMVCQTCGATAAAGSYCGECGGTLADSGGDELVGSQVGPYKLAKVLGEGGMGRVYLGVHPSIGSRVAVKVLSASCAEKPDLVDRFFAEAKAVNLIRHESIVNVLDLSKLPDGRPFIVMEYLDGAPLSSILLRGPLPLGSALRLATEVLGALSAAHAKGIVHRDLKPDNIFVSPQGRAKVLDFGIAKLLPEIAGSATPTQTGALLGTPHYMSPEQALAKRIDHRADIYAMGLILFECVTGQGAFNGESLYELLHRQVHEPPPYPKSLRPDLPDAYQDIILAALVKEPERRLPNAEEFIRRLGEISKSLTGDAWAPIGTRVDAASQQMAVMATPSGSGSRPGARPGEPLQPMQQALSHAPTMGATGAPTRDRVPPVKRKSSRMPIILAVLVALGAAGATAAVLAMGGGDDETTASAAGSADSEDEDSGDETDKGDSSDDSSDEVDKVAAAGDSDDGKSKSSANDGAKLKAEAEDSKSGSKAKAEADKAKAKAKAKAEAEAAAKAEADEAKAEAEAAKAKG